MPILTISEDLQVVIDKAVEQDEYADAVEYVAHLVRQDQKRRAKEQIFAALTTQTEDHDDEMNALAESWQKLRRERHQDHDAD